MHARLQRQAVGLHAWQGIGRELLYPHSLGTPSLQRMNTARGPGLGPGSTFDLPHAVSLWASERAKACVSNKQSTGTSPLGEQRGWQHFAEGWAVPCRAKTGHESPSRASCCLAAPRTMKSKGSSAPLMCGGHVSFPAWPQDVPSTDPLRAPGPQQQKPRCLPRCDLASSSPAWRLGHDSPAARAFFPSTCQPCLPSLAPLLRPHLVHMGGISLLRPSCSSASSGKRPWC